MTPKETDTMTDVTRTRYIADLGHFLVWLLFDVFLLASKGDVSEAVDADFREEEVDSDGS